MLYLDERRSFRLGLDHACWLALQEQEVIHAAMRLFQGELAHRHTGPSTEIQRLMALDYPPVVCKLFIDLNTCLRLTGKVVVVT